MGHPGHPEFVKTPPLQVAIKSDELKAYYDEGRRCCLAIHEGEHWVDMIACDNWPDVPYYAGYYGAFSRNSLEDSKFVEELIIMDCTVVDIEDIPALESGESIILIHKDVTVTHYTKIEDFISTVEALQRDPELHGDFAFDEMTVVIGRIKGIKWREQLVRQTKHWTVFFDQERATQRRQRMLVEVGEVND